MLGYISIAVILLVAELVYFKIADHFNIVDKTNERSSHSRIVLRGGGVIFTFSIIAWTVMMLVQGNDITDYIPFLVGLLMVAESVLWMISIRCRTRCVWQCRLWHSC